jgi:hypothetical protein
MTLQDLLTHAQRAETGVPDWMLGFFKRRSISFANGAKYSLVRASRASTSEGATP